MAAKYDKSKLRDELTKYIEKKPVEKSLRELLKSSPVDVKFNLLTTVTGGEFSDSAVSVAAHQKDEETLELLLAEFTPQQKYEVAKMQSSATGWTALHWVAFSFCTNMVICLLLPFTYQQRYNVLKLQDSRGNTAMHIAAQQKKIQVLETMLSFATPQQRAELMNLENNKEKTISNMEKLPKLNIDSAAWTTQDITDLDDIKREIAMLNANYTKQQKEVDKQAKELRDANQQITKLQADVDKQAKEDIKLHTRCNQLVKDSTQQTQEQAATNYKLDVSNQKVAELETALERQGLTDVQQEVADLKTESIKQTEEQAAANHKLDVSNQKATELEAELERQKEDRTKLSQEQAAANHKLEAIQIDMDKQREDKTQLTQELRDTNQRIVSLREDLERKKDENIKLTERCVQLETDRDRQTRELTDAQEEIADLKTEAIRQTEEQAAANHKLDVSNQKVTELEAELERQKEDKTKLSQELRDARQDISILKFCCTQQQTEVATQTRALEEMTNRQNVMERMLEELDMELRRPIFTDETGDQELEELEEEDDN